VKQLQSTLSL